MAMSSPSRTVRTEMDSSAACRLDTDMVGTGSLEPGELLRAVSNSVYLPTAPSSTGTVAKLAWEPALDAGSTAAVGSLPTDLLVSALSPLLIQSKGMMAVGTVTGSDKPDFPPGLAGDYDPQELEDDTSTDAARSSDGKGRSSEVTTEAEPEPEQDVESPIHQDRRAGNSDFRGAWTTLGCSNYCAYCGAAVAPNLLLAKFCTYCGARRIPVQPMHLGMQPGGMFGGAAASSPAMVHTELGSGVGGYHNSGRAIESAATDHGAATAGEILAMQTAMAAYTAGWQQTDAWPCYDAWYNGSEQSSFPVW